MGAGKKIKICLVASAGGHLSQLLKLVDSWNGYETFSIATTEVVREKLQKFGPVYTVGECNRQHPILVFKVLLQCIRITLKERPDVIISTGAAAGEIACAVCEFNRDANAFARQKHAACKENTSQVIQRRGSLCSASAAPLLCEANDLNKALQLTPYTMEKMVLTTGRG